MNDPCKYDGVVGKYVFHYTGAEALLGIVKSRQLWATDIEYLNDRYEGAQPSMLLEKIADYPDVYLGLNHRVPLKHLEAMKHSLRTGAAAVTVSFSNDFRSLPQFRMYSPSAGGYAIGFPRALLEQVDTVVECDYSYPNCLEWCKTYIAAYSAHATQLDNANVSAEELNNRVIQTTDVVRQRLEAGFRFKSDEFINEKEVRLYRVSPIDLLFRASRKGNYVIPYLPVNLPNEPVEVMLAAGPNRDPSLATRSIGNLMRAAKDAGTKWQFAHLGTGEFGFRS